MREITKGVDRDAVTYIFLIRDREKAAGMSAAQRTREMRGVNKAVQKFGGQCRLFSTRGSAFEFVSVITGISAAAAIRIAEEIESGGSVKATLMSGLEVFTNR